MRTARVRSLLPLLLLCHAAAALPRLAFAAPTPAPAGAVKVAVVDKAGKPLQDAVVMLESVSGRMSAKPLPQVDVSQTKRQFNPQVTVITVGTAVNFPNFDTVRHQVYSFSAIKSFELKLYAGVPNAPVVFDKPGIAVLGCNIHDQMAAWVVVVETPYFARTPASGEVRLDHVAAGVYQVRVWHPGLVAGKEPEPRDVTVGGAEVSARVQLPATPLSP